MFIFIYLETSNILSVFIYWDLFHSEINFRNKHHKTAHSMAQTENSIFIFMVNQWRGYLYITIKNLLIFFSFFAKSITILLTLLFYLSSHHTLASFPPFFSLVTFFEFLLALSVHSKGDDVEKRRGALCEFWVKFWIVGHVY